MFRAQSNGFSSRTAIAICRYFDRCDILIRIDFLSLSRLTVKLLCYETDFIGKRAGDEVVQLYVRDKVSSVITYDSQLRGFERVSLQPGETRQVTFSLKPEDLQILDRNMNWTVEPGEFEVMIGASSQDIRLKKTITALP